jgi:hypothetical protein
LAAAVLVSSPAIELALNAASKVQDQPYELAFFTNKEEAWDYLQQKRAEFRLA